jgi:hypothetical protein
MDFPPYEIKLISINQYDIKKLGKRQPNMLLKLTAKALTRSVAVERRT